MGVFCCLYMSGGTGRVREDKKSKESRGDGVTGGGGATVYRALRGDRDLNFGSHHCGIDIKYMTM